MHNALPFTLPICLAIIALARPLPTTQTKPKPTAAPVRLDVPRSPLTARYSLAKPRSLKCPCRDCTRLTLLPVSDSSYQLAIK